MWKSRQGRPWAWWWRKRAVGAGAHREGAQQQVEGLPDGVGVGVGAEVLGVAPPPAPHHGGPRPLLPAGDRQVGVGLVVAQADVEAGAVLLDEVVLHHQGRHLAVGDDPLHRGGGVHHGLGADRQVAAEVRREALAQRLRLSHVEHLAVGVAEQVGPRRVGDLGGRGPALHEPAGYRPAASAPRQPEAAGTGPAIARLEPYPAHGEQAGDLPLGGEQRVLGRPALPHPVLHQALQAPPGGRGRGEQVAQ